MSWEKITCYLCKRPAETKDILSCPGIFIECPGCGKYQIGAKALKFYFIKNILDDKALNKLIAFVKTSKDGGVALITSEIIIEVTGVISQESKY